MRLYKLLVAEARGEDIHRRTTEEIVEAVSRFTLQANTYSSEMTRLLKEVTTASKFGILGKIIPNFPSTMGRKGQTGMRQEHIVGLVVVHFLTTEQSLPLGGWTKLS